MASGTGKKPRSSPVIHVIQILRCFSTDTPELGVTEIAESVGLHKSSVSRILNLLEEEAIVERDAQSLKYRLGLGLMGIAGSLLATLDVRRYAYPVLQELAEETGETATLVLWEGAAGVTVEQAAGSQRIKHTSPMGSRYNTMDSASVKVLLADQAPGTATKLLKSGQILGEHGVRVEDDSIIAEFEAQLEHVRNAGFAVNYCQTFDDEVGIAARILDFRSMPAGCVMMAAPAYRVDEKRLNYLRDSCWDAASEISHRLGFSD